MPGEQGGPGGGLRVRQERPTHRPRVPTVPEQSQMLPKEGKEPIAPNHPVNGEGRKKATLEKKREEEKGGCVARHPKGDGRSARGQVTETL